MVELCRRLIGAARDGHSARWFATILDNRGLEYAGSSRPTSGPRRAGTVESWQCDPIRLEYRNVTMRFAQKAGHLTAVERVSIAVRDGEVVSLMGRAAAANRHLCGK